MEHRILGDYKIIKSIGNGTLGMVYLSEHRYMKRQFILKILPEELATDRGFIQRFEEEISVLSSLDHPNIVKIYNISFSQGQFFLVTDCIVDELGETTNLAQYLSGLRGPLDEENIYNILKQVAEPLDYAHSKKIGNQELVHRGLKLNNILVGKGHNGIQIYLSDFGLSRLIGPGAVLTRIFKNVSDAIGLNFLTSSIKMGQDRYPNPPIETQKLIPLHTSFLQSYAFLSPEQKKIDAGQSIDGKSDTYAFGVLAYLLLMKELPEGIFEMPSNNSTYRYKWNELIQACLQQDPSKRPERLVETLEKVCMTTSSSYSSEPAKLENMESELAARQFAAKYIVSLDEINKEVSQLAAVPQSEVEEDSLVKNMSNFSQLKPVFSSPQLERPKTDLDPAAIFQVDSTVKLYHPEHKDVTHVKPMLTDMIVIKGGSFFRGSQDGNRDEMPRHQVTISSFAIDIHPVTNEQFVLFLEVMGGEKDSNHTDIIRLRDSRIKRSGGKLSIESGYTKHPVVGVTWYGAIAYAKWVGKRLPKEAEWEIAARGGMEGALYPTGEEIEKTQANFFSSDTIAVMSYPPNGYGLYDMAGNVYEWCYDWYGYNYYELSVQEPDDPQGPLQGVYRVLRGGCWKSLKEDLRCSRRHRNNPGTVNGTYGFRCVANVQVS